jgi:uncharacterized protein YciI
MNSLFIVDIRYTGSLDAIDAQMPAHMTFLKKYYADNIFLTSGRKVPRSGGIIIALCTDKQTLENIMAEDPFYQKKLATVTITEFQTSQVHPTMKVLLDGLRK